jgi:putative ATPase
MGRISSFPRQLLLSDVWPLVAHAVRLAAFFIDDGSRAFYVCSMPGLFDPKLHRKTVAPLADRMRPTTFDELSGQEALVGAGKPLRLLVESDRIPSMIFWGPPGSGKTTLAKIIATATKSVFIELSAVSSGLADVREVIRNAEDRLGMRGERTILFIDEIHRFNKSQQDAFLPHVEAGTITLIGATTENPSFEVNSALLSRSKVFVLQKIDGDAMKAVLRRALGDKERGLGTKNVTVPEEVLDELVILADGDARTALNALELAVNASPKQADGVTLSIDHLRSALQRTHFLYDQKGEEHYNIISALHKSLRGSDVDAALYWLARQLESGEDPLYIARRLVRFASEDIGMADPNALIQAVAAYQASHFIGMPECNVILAQCVAYLAKAPKSNKLYTAYKAAADDVRRLPNASVPLHIRNGVTKLMKDLNYGKGYKYNPDFEGPVEQDYLPEQLKGRKYFT